jgi:hypothetical protein
MSRLKIACGVIGNPDLAIGALPNQKLQKKIEVVDFS